MSWGNKYNRKPNKHLRNNKHNLKWNTDYVNYMKAYVISCALNGKKPSKIGFAAEYNLSRRTIAGWIEEYPDFAKAFLFSAMDAKAGHVDNMLKLAGKDATLCRILADKFGILAMEKLDNTINVVITDQSKDDEELGEEDAD